MILRIDHVSIAVKDYEKALHFFKNILGAIPGACAKDDNMKYVWQLFSFGDLSRLELMKPTGEGSFLDNFLKNKKDGGVHHITLQVQNIYEAMETLKQNQIPFFGFNNIADIWKEIFIHPKDAFGILIQLAEFNADDWLDSSVKFPSGQKWEIEKDEFGCTLNFAHPGGGKAKLKLNREEIKKLINNLQKELI
ncbi:MAG: VOC family protein [Desulfobacterales bacterium]|nr:VOC family protein [Desulfobacterales bacterium]MBF0395730.1 VOC family protein [Desulfobacterales bacterium]